MTEPEWHRVNRANWDERVGVHIGPGGYDQLMDNLKALEVAITDEDRKRIDSMVEPGAHVSTYYAAEFGPNARWM